MLPPVEELGIRRPKEFLKEYSHSFLSFLNCLPFTLDKIFKKKYKYKVKMSF